MAKCPQQANTYDCGVFACWFARCLTLDIDFDFDQSNAPWLRKQITYELAQFCIIGADASLTSVRGTISLLQVESRCQQPGIVYCYVLLCVLIPAHC